MPVGLVPWLGQGRGAAMLDLTSALRLRNGNAEAENRALAFPRFEFHRPIVPLQNLISLCQTNAAAIFFSGEVKLENLVVQLLGNAAAPIVDLDHHHLVLAPRRDGKQSSLRHRLDSIQHDVE